MSQVTPALNRNQKRKKSVQPVETASNVITAVHNVTLAVVDLALQTRQCEDNSIDQKLTKTKKVLKRMKLSVNNENKEDHGDDKRSKPAFGDCPICYDPLGTNPLASTKCGHVFCLQCIRRAYKVEKKCPTCRTDLKCKKEYHPLYLSLLPE